MDCSSWCWDILNLAERDREGGWGDCEGEEGEEGADSEESDWTGMIFFLLLPPAPVVPDMAWL